MTNTTLDTNADEWQVIDCDNSSGKYEVVHNGDVCAWFDDISLAERFVTYMQAAQKNEGQHTPGPWELAEASSCIPIKAGKRTIASVPFNPENDLDNARLIAAAPDLLNALKGFVNYHDGDEQLSFQIYARAAIAKARGE